MKNKLKELKLKRHSKVGKKMGSKIWAHIDYIEEIVPYELLRVVFHRHEFRNIDFKITLFRYDKKSNQLCFFECNDFDTAHEPSISKSFCTKSLSKFKHKKESIDNPPIYHHKWMFVKDDYQGFDVDESKKRSIEWKEILGTNREVSNCIGRKVFWKNWLKEKGLEL